MAKRAKPTQLFKKLCTRCDNTYRPSGKYNRICQTCMEKAMKARKDNAAKTIKLKNRKV